MAALTFKAERGGCGSTRPDHPAEMKLLMVAVALLGLLSAAAHAQTTKRLPLCDSPEAEEAALEARDHLNALHTHGYKYALNRIEDIKVYTEPDGNSMLLLEIELLETDCHVLDPTPVANCTVRPKVMTAVEGDCDVILRKVGGNLTLTDFKCKTEESTEDFCVGCHRLLPLNDSTALDFLRHSLDTFNNRTENQTFLLQEVGRMSSQVVSGGPAYLVEYVIVEGNCTKDSCSPSDDAMAARGLCTAKGSHMQHIVDCKMFPSAAAGVDAVVHKVTSSHTHRAGLGHHKLPSVHSPELIGLFSVESSESDEVVAVSVADSAPGVKSAPVAVDAAPVAVDAAPAAADAAPATGDAAPAAADAAPAAADAALAAADSSSAADDSESSEVPIIHLLKRDVSAALDAAPVADGIPSVPVSIQPVCPGRIRFF